MLTENYQSHITLMIDNILETQIKRQFNVSIFPLYSTYSVDYFGGFF